MKRTTLLATLFTAAALAGCANVGGTPTTAPTPSPTGTSNTGSTGSPAATELKIDKFKDKPCDLLTAAQITQLGNVKEPKTRQAAIGLACEWNGKDILEDSSYEVAVNLDQAYETQLENSRSFPVFSEKTIQGIRTFNSDSTDGTRSCTAIAEAGKTGILQVDVDVAKNKVATQKPCAEAERVAAMAIENLRG